MGALCGFLTIVCGVFLLHAFKDINFTLMDLIELTSQQNTAGVNSSSSSSSSSTCSGGGGGSLDSPTAQPPHRTTSFSRSSRHGSQTSILVEGHQRTSSLTRSPYVTNGNPDSEEDELFSADTVPLVQSATDS